jgi:hypothetical protein
LSEVDWRFAAGDFTLTEGYPSVELFTTISVFAVEDKTFQALGEVAHAAYLSGKAIGPDQVLFNSLTIAAASNSDKALHLMIFLFLGTAGIAGVTGQVVREYCCCTPGGLLHLSDFDSGSRQNCPCTSSGKSGKLFLTS